VTAALLSFSWQALAFGYALFVICWVLYLAIMNIARVRDQLHPVAKFHAYCIILPVGYIADAMLNLLVCAIFLRPPRDWLLTGTLQRIRFTEPVNSWRETVAAWICTHLLNQFDPKGKHC
jgi:hypothetical protein